MPKTTEEKKSAADLLPRHFKSLADELIEVHGKEKASKILANAATMIRYPGSENMTAGLYMAACFAGGDE
jgi:hypothetical protein